MNDVLHGPTQRWDMGPWDASSQSVLTYHMRIDSRALIFNASHAVHTGASCGGHPARSGVFCAQVYLAGDVRALAIRFGSWDQEAVVVLPADAIVRVPSARSVLNISRYVPPEPLARGSSNRVCPRRFENRLFKSPDDDGDGYARHWAYALVEASPAQAAALGATDDAWSRYMSRGFSSKNSSAPGSQLGGTCKSAAFPWLLPRVFFVRKRSVFPNNGSTEGAVYGQDVGLPVNPTAKSLRWVRACDWSQHDAIATDTRNQCQAGASLRVAVANMVTSFVAQVKSVIPGVGAIMSGGDADASSALADDNSSVVVSSDNSTAVNAGSAHDAESDDRKALDRKMISTAVWTLVLQPCFLSFTARLQVHVHSLFHVLESHMNGELPVPIELAAMLLPPDHSLFRVVGMQLFVGMNWLSWCTALMFLVRVTQDTSRALPR